MVNEHITEKIIEDIANKIDPDGTFLQECEEIVQQRFGDNLCEVEE